MEGVRREWLMSDETLCDFELFKFAGLGPQKVLNDCNFCLCCFKMNFLAIMRQNILC